MGKITIVGDAPKTAGLPELTAWVGDFAKDTIQQVNGNLTFSENIKCNILDVVFDTANSSAIVRHTLGKVPVAYLLIGSDNPTSLYSGAVATVDTITLQSSAIARTKVLVF